MSKTSIYLDHAATTPVRPEVLDAMLPYLGSERFGNPSSGHAAGREAGAGLEQARREVAQALGVEPGEVIFTSGGTEADTLAIVGRALAARAGGAPMRVAVGATEHKAVLAAAHAVRRLGGEERLLPVDGQGLLNLEALDIVLEDRPSIVSVMWANNETGVIQPVAEIAARCAKRGVSYHTDMVQAFGRVPTLLEQGVALATISGHKLGAPKGIGALVVRKGTALEPILHGGNQQRGVRPGTENVAGAVGLGRAVSLALGDLSREAERLAGLRDALAARIQAEISEATVVGEGSPRLPNILNVAFRGAENSVLLMHLDLAGVAASGGSACQTGAAEPSHVLLAMGLPRERAIGAVRFSLGRGTTEGDIARVATILPGIVAKVRAIPEAMAHD
jgi:cysteine desulfurase